MAKSKSSTKIILLLVVGGITYYLYSKKIGPFTSGGLFDQLKAKISGVPIPGAPSLTPAIPPALPSTVSAPLLYCLDSSAIDSVTGLCADGHKPITQNIQQAAVSQKFCQDGSIPNATSGLCSNGMQPITYFCTDGSTMNMATGLCANGLKPTPTVVPAAIATPTGGDIQAGVVPPTGPQVSSDQSVQNTFLKGLYEQIFNPYSSAQALGLSQLAPGSIGSTFACADGSTADPITNICSNGAPPVPTMSGYNQLPTTGSPGFNIGTRSPIVGGDVPAGTPSAQTVAEQQVLGSQYGLYPPGGSLTGVDANALFPNFDTGAGSITGLSDTPTTPPAPTGPVLSSTCFTDSTGQTWCQATNPDATCQTVGGNSYCPQGGGCITLSGQQYCPSSSSSGPGCIVVGSQLYCPKVTATPAPPSTACPPGYTYDNTHGLCLQNTQSAPPVTPTCPTGYTYNSTNQVCVQNPPVTPPGPGNCTTGTRWSPCFQACLPAGILEPNPGSPQCVGYVAPTGNNTTVTPAPPVTVPTDTGLLGACIVQSGIQYCPCNSLQPGSIVQNGQVYCSQQAAIPPAPVTTPPAVTPPPTPVPPIPVVPTCPSGYQMSSGGHCVNCSTGTNMCCSSPHDGNCHVECGFTGHDDGSARCAQCLSVCGSYNGECNCSSHTAR